MPHSWQRAESAVLSLDNACTRWWPTPDHKSIPPYVILLDDDLYAAGMSGKTLITCSRQLYTHRSDQGPFSIKFLPCLCKRTLHATGSMDELLWQKSVYSSFASIKLSTKSSIESCLKWSISVILITVGLLSQRRVVFIHFLTGIEHLINIRNAMTKIDISCLSSVISTLHVAEPLYFSFFLQAGVATSATASDLSTEVEECCFAFLFSTLKQDVLFLISLTITFRLMFLFTVYGCCKLLPVILSRASSAWSFFLRLCLHCIVFFRVSLCLF